MVTNDKDYKEYSYSDRLERKTYRAMAREYRDFAKEKYGIKLKIPKLFMSKEDPANKEGEEFSNIVGYYSKIDKTITVYKDKVNSTSKENRKNGLIEVFAHELGHALADQLNPDKKVSEFINILSDNFNAVKKRVLEMDQALEKNQPLPNVPFNLLLPRLNPLSLDSYVGQELTANLFAAQVLVKSNHKHVTNEEISKQLLNMANLSSNTKSNDSILNSLESGLNEDSKVLNEGYDYLNKTFSNGMDKGLDLARKGGNANFYLKLKDLYIDEYKKFYKLSINAISMLTTRADIYDIPMIGAANALVNNGVSPDKIINAHFTEASTGEGGVFTIPELNKYKSVAKAGNDIKDHLKLNLDEWYNSSIENLKTNLGTELYQHLLENGSMRLSNSDNLNKLLDIYENDYKSMVNENKDNLNDINRFINETIKALPDVSKELKEINSKLYPNSDKLRKE